MLQINEEKQNYSRDNRLMASAQNSVRRWFHLHVLFVALIVFGFGLARSAHAQDSLCATVKIEILQELALERQAFDARMRIDNGLDTLALENVNVDVLFEDADENAVLATSDPDDTNAAFFIRIDSLEGISDVSGTGMVQPSTDAVIRWLIIPSAGAGGLSPSGELYFVGATLTYTLGGEPHVVEVIPDAITVKPQPVLVLDYFLTKDVFADDPFTGPIEPPEPFTLGVRVKNVGSGLAQRVSIDSAQPRIVENEQSLLIGFEITSSFVNDEPAQETLLINFGEVESQSSKVGRWLMETTLSGEFVDFSAEFTHSDELGGALTSLLQETNTHFLLQDVLVDLPGRDSVRDFLALDGSVVRLYESDSIDTEVTDQSVASTFVASGGGNFTLTTPITAGPMYVQLSDPFAGSQEIRSVLRSDGRSLPAGNAWTSKTGNGNDGFQYFVNFFDVNGGGTYTVQVGTITLGPVAPNMQFIANKTVIAGGFLGFLVEASDQNGTTPVLTADALPVGATFVDDGNGQGTFTWVPLEPQVGSYSVTFRASDGVLDATRTPSITVTSALDTDGDGMDDQFEIDNFGDLSRDGTGDFDNDGVSDLDEFLNGTDPTQPPGAPDVPVIVSPLFDADVTSLQPDLTVQNVPHGPELVSYDFEVYADAGMTILVASATGVTEGAGNTTFTVDVVLNDNTVYWWRARAASTFGISEWVNGLFFVNTANDAPGPFNTSQPLEGSTVATLTPLLEVTNSVDVDRDVLTYAFAVATDPNQQNLVAAVADLPEGTGGTTDWTVEPSLLEDTLYYWSAIATDPNGLIAMTPTATFFVSTINDPPAVPTILAPLVGAEVLSTDVDLAVSNAPDPEADPVSYVFEVDTVDTFDSPNLILSGPVAEGDPNTIFVLTGLSDNTRHHWRVKATDGNADSDWVVANFFVNTVNDPPSVPTVNNPGDGAFVDLLQPVLTLNPATDVDEDSLTYEFEVYADAALTQFVTGSGPTGLSWPVGVILTNHTNYYWRARAEDEHGLISDWTSVHVFFVNEDGINDPPIISVDEPSQETTVTGTTVLIRWMDADPDSNALIELFANGVSIASAIEEDPDGASDTFIWDVTGVAPGTYLISATITDEDSNASADACCNVIIPDTGGGECGNGVLDPGEQCDDGNTKDLDGCSAICGDEPYQTKDQQACINALNKDLAKVSSMWSLGTNDCIKNFAKGKTANLGPGGTAQSCLTADVKGKVLKATDKTVSDFDKRCTGVGKTGLSRLPDFDPTDALVVNSAVETEQEGLVAAIMGANLDTSLLTESADRDASKCQQAVIKSVLGCHQSKVKEFSLCKKNALKIIAGNLPAVASAGELRDLCLGVGAANQPDEKARIAKSCNLVELLSSGKFKLDKIRKGLDKRCVAKGVDLQVAFPVCGASDREGVYACLKPQIECGFCRMLNQADGLDRDCDLFDDGQTNLSCTSP